ncbi:MAG: hypothetical protein HEQ23_04315 [Tepidisphaera sp.]|jgi:hypothetical protein
MRHGMLQAGMSRADVLALVAGSVVVGCLGVSMTIADPSGRGERLSESLSNLRAIGSAMGQYRADNAGYTPLEGTTTRRRPNEQQLEGLCGWQFGGKNTSAFWFGQFGGSFDIEAADRPLNPYLYPEFTFTAPAPPARLASNAPQRSAHQARVFRDPADLNSRQRRWPDPNNPPISTYDDVGTSYLFNLAWLNQVGGLNVRSLRSATARLATDQGVDPARFVYLADGVAEVVLYQPNPGFRLMGNHGVENAGVTLFADGHSGLVTYRPGMTRASRVNEVYSVLFEDLGRPGGLERRGLPESVSR